jgi:cold shock CspA family protein
MKGKVKIVIPEKGYGFIRGDVDKVEYFFHRQDFIGHWDDLCTDVSERERNTVQVEYELVDSPKGPRAANVSRLDFPNSVDGVDNGKGQEDIRDSRRTSEITDRGTRRFQKPRGLR